jgi:hypothetical protein
VGMDGSVKKALELCTRDETSLAGCLLCFSCEVNRSMPSQG